MGGASATRLAAPLQRHLKIVAFLDKEKAAKVAPAAAARPSRPMPSIRDLAVLTNLTYQDDVEVTKKGAPAGWEFVTRATRDKDYGLSVDIWQNHELMVTFATIRGTHEGVTWLTNAGLGSDQTPSWFYVIRDHIPDLLDLGNPNKAADEAGKTPAVPAAATTARPNALKATGAAKALINEINKDKPGAPRQDPRLKAIDPEKLVLKVVNAVKPPGAPPVEAASDGAMAAQQEDNVKPVGELLEGVLEMAKKNVGRRPRPAAALLVMAAVPPPADSPDGQAAPPPPPAAPEAEEETYQLILGGHSLGACVAELLAVDQDLPAVTWESPGIGGMEIMYRSTKTNKDESAMRAARAQNRIVSFLSGPNMVNTCNPHPCPVYRLYIPYIKPDGEEKASMYAMAASAGRVGLLAALPVALMTGSFGTGVDLALASAAVTLGSSYLLQKDMTVTQHDMDALAHVCNAPGGGYTVKGFNPKNPEAAGVDSSQLRVRMKDWPKKLPSFTPEGAAKSVLGLLLPFGKYNHSALNASRPNDIFEQYNTSIAGYEVETIIEGPDAQKAIDDALLNACTWKYSA